MQTEFDIHIKDNFIDADLYESIYEKIPFYTYSGQGHKYVNKVEDHPHLFFGAPVEKEIADYIRKKCEKLYNKNFKENYCTYTMVQRSKPMVHCDAGEFTTHQIIVYIRGDVGLHRGTGFYIEKNNEYELNTHIGFNENRAIFWYSPVFHSPLLWNDENKSKRFSIIAQYKEIK
tara:strand:+ start:1328 stop:1849 length:522 start_codon:yes stop_codon:yes gene_type:complete